MIYELAVSFDQVCRPCIKGIYASLGQKTSENTFNLLLIEQKNEKGEACLHTPGDWVDALLMTSSDESGEERMANRSVAFGD